MNIKEQTFYDIKLTDGDELGKELFEIVNDERKQNKNCDVVVHQVIQIDRKSYTAIFNILER